MTVQSHFEKGETMKSVVAIGTRQERPIAGAWRAFALAVALGIVALLFGGCSWQQPGETVAETNRRHQRNMRLNNQMMLSDIDKALMLDRPSGLTDMRIP
jgi:hypothetical protein